MWRQIPFKPKSRLRIRERILREERFWALAIPSKMGFADLTRTIW